MAVATLRSHKSPCTTSGRLSQCCASAAGNFTEPLLLISGVLLLTCILTGYWELLWYAILGVVIYILVLAYAMYLENNNQNEVERRHRARSMRPKPRREHFYTAASSVGSGSSSTTSERPSMARDVR